MLHKVSDRVFLTALALLALMLGAIPFGMIGLGLAHSHIVCAVS